MSINASHEKVSSQNIQRMTKEDDEGTLLYYGILENNKKIGQGVETLKKNEEGKTLIISSYVGSFYEDERNNEGVLFYKNGDVCLSTFMDGIPQGKGFYFWCSTTEDYQEADEDCKREYLKFNNAFYGEFKNGQISKGLLFSNLSKDERLKEEEKIDILYYGCFNEDGKKEDDNGVFLDLKNHIFLIGKFENNLFEEGYELHLDQNLKIVKTFYIIKYKNKIKEIFFRKARDEKEVETIEKFANEFIEYYVTGNNQIYKIDKFPKNCETKKIFEKAYVKAKNYFLFRGAPALNDMQEEWNPYIYNDKLSQDLREKYNNISLNYKSESDDFSSHSMGSKE